jgi:lauroyl/myristoyl acyltransferase
MKLRERIYIFSIYAGLFYLMPLMIKLPDSLARFFLRFKAWFRYIRGTYRAYVNRDGLKNIAIRNLSATLGLDEKVSRRKVHQLMQLEVFAEREGFLFDRYTLTSLEQRFIVKGLEVLDLELRNKRGIIFVTIHSGDTVLFMLYLSLRGYNIYGLFDGAILDKNMVKEKVDPLYRFALLKDKKITGRIGKLYTGHGMYRIFDALRENGIIVWMIDLPVQNRKRETVIDFLGSKVRVNNSFWTVAAKSGASILPYINIFDFEKNKHLAYIGSPIDTSRNTLQDIFNFYEPYIRHYPESWLGWYFFDIWKVS